MKSRYTFAVALLAFAAGSTSAAAQSTAFTFQGELKSGGSAANGPYDMRFTLFDAPSGGTPVTSTTCVNDVQVVDGKFTVTIDFGQQFANTFARHIQIDLRQDSGAPCTDVFGYVTLSPRQQITAAPRAIAANTAFSLAAPDGTPSTALSVSNAGNVGIGTSTPSAPLQVVRDVDPIIIIQDSGPNSTQAGYVGFWNSTGVETGWVGFGSPGDPDLTILNARSGGDIVLNPVSGDVGIGTGDPTAKLEVRGSIKLGPSGQFFAPKALADDRIVRGRVNSAGAPIAGTGFTSSNPATGTYSINYSAAGFSTAPVIVATPECVGCSVSVTGPTTVTTQVRVRDSSGAAINSGFSFIMMGN